MDVKGVFSKQVRYGFSPDEMREIDMSHMNFLKRSNEFDRCRQNQLDKWNIDSVGKVDERETLIKNQCNQ